MTKRTSDHPSMRVRNVVDATGTGVLEMSVQCPECDNWSSLSGAFEQFLVDSMAKGDVTERTTAKGTSRGIPRTPISAIMSKQVVSVRPDETIEAIVALFMERGIGGVPVVDEDGTTIGVVTKTDLALAGLVAGETFTEERVRLRTRGGVEYDPGAGFHTTELTRATAKEVMSPTPLSLSPEATVMDAAALMAAKDIHRILVMERGAVVGIVSSLDVLRWFALNAQQVSMSVVEVAPAEESVAEAMEASAPVIEAARDTIPSEPVRAVPAMAANGNRDGEASPVVHRPAHFPPAAPRSPSMRPGDVRIEAKKRDWILVVDDDADLCDELAELLESEGYTVGKAANGLEALEQIRRGGVPSLILLDLGMPVMNGWAFQQELRNRPELAETPVVVVSGANDEPRRVLAKTGAAAYLAKPLTPTNLLGAVHRYCDAS